LTRQRAQTLIALLLLVFVVQGASTIRTSSPTYDEAMHLASGYSYLATRDFRLERQNPPFLKELLALPIRVVHRLPFQPDPQEWAEAADFWIGQDFVYRSSVPADHLLTYARLANLLLGAALIIAVASWAWHSWGPAAAVIAASLAAIDPTVVAHSSLITTDTGVTLFLFLTIFQLWRYLQSPRWTRLLFAGGFLGFAVTSKYSAIVLLPILAVVFALCAVVRGPSFALPGARAGMTIARRLLDAGVVLGVTTACASAVIPLAYLGQGVGPWLDGLQHFTSLAQAGQAAFFLGEHSYDGWRSYFVTAFLIKTPIGTLVLVGASLLLYRVGLRLTLREAVFLMAPVIVIVAVVSMSHVNIGVRHILPAYPFLFVAASRLATVSMRRQVRAAVIGLPLGWAAASSLLVAPEQLAYFNELVGGPSNGYRYLGDSNVDWGQDLKRLKTYMGDEGLSIVYLSYFGTAPPEYYGIRYQFAPGSWPLEWPASDEKVPADARQVLVISVNNLNDLAAQSDPLYGWLRDRQPIARIGYSLFVFDFNGDRAALQSLHETYLRVGLRGLVEGSPARSTPG